MYAIKQLYKPLCASTPVFVPSLSLDISRILILRHLEEDEAYTNPSRWSKKEELKPMSICMTRSFYRRHADSNTYREKVQFGTLGSSFML